MVMQDSEVYDVLLSIEKTVQVGMLLNFGAAKGFFELFAEYHLAWRVVLSLSPRPERGIQEVAARLHRHARERVRVWRGKQAGVYGNFPKIRGWS